MTARKLPDSAAGARGQGGVTLLELLVVIGILGIIMAASAPLALRVLRTSELRAGAEEVAVVLGRARQLAIKENVSICVTNVGTTLWQYHKATCTAPPWVLPETDTSGSVRLSNNITVTNAQVVFTYIGTATAQTTYTINDPQGGGTLTVNVTPAGRISIGP